MAEITPQETVVCYIGLGSNLGDRRETILRAVALLKAVPGIRVLQVSGLEQTRAIGPDQPDYLNSVAAIETTLEPIELLDRLQDIEHQLGRQRDVRWGPRTMDMDILYYGHETIDHPRLTVPHPQIDHREFVQRHLKEVGFHG